MEDVDVRAVLAAFARLGIEPTLDVPFIKRAFKAAALKTHPDHFTSEADKKAAHYRFIELAEARDLVLEFVDSGVLIDHLYASSGVGGPRQGANRTRSGETEHTYARPNTTSQRSTQPTSGGASGAQRQSAYEEEWRVFVADENAYFRIFESASATVAVLIQALGVSTFVSVCVGGLALLAIPFLAIVILLLVAFFSASFAIPILGWIAAFLALGVIGNMMSGLWHALDGAVDSAARSMLKTVARTGYPTRSFWFALIFALALVLALAVFMSYHGLSALAWLLGALFVVMAGSMLWVWNRIGEHLASLDEAFAKIRASSSYALVLAKRT